MNAGTSQTFFCVPVAIASRGELTMATTRPKISLFAHHPRQWESFRYVYPVVSRRAKGLSIGVNLNPDKVCNFDCIYCCVDRTIPPVVRKVDLGELGRELEQVLSLAATGDIFTHPPFDRTPPVLRRINDIAFSGDGEPTSYKRFEDACRLAADLLKRHNLPDARIVVITNATLLQRAAVRQAMEFLDRHNGEIWAKLDAGTEAYYRLIERTSIPLDRVLQNILAAGRIRPIVIQSLFMLVHGQPPPAGEIDAYIARLRDLRDGGCQIKLAQVYTVARGTAEAYVKPLELAALERIARGIRELGIPAETFGAPA